LEFSFEPRVVFLEPGAGFMLFSRIILLYSFLNLRLIAERICLAQFIYSHTSGKNFSLFLFAAAFPFLTARKSHPLYSSSFRGALTKVTMATTCRITIIMTFTVTASIFCMVADLNTAQN
jgi:hypothetical protein